MNCTTSTPADATAALIRFAISIIALTAAGAGAAAQTASSAPAAAFIHPGGLQTREDLDRIKTGVAAGDHPWIDSWNELIKNPKAQLDYRPAPQANMGASRQRASADAVAAWLCAVRGYVSGDVAYTD